MHHINWKNPDLRSAGGTSSAAPLASPGGGANWGGCPQLPIQSDLEIMANSLGIFPAVPVSADVIR